MFPLKNFPKILFRARFSGTDTKKVVGDHVKCSKNFFRLELNPPSSLHTNDLDVGDLRVNGYMR